MPANDKSDWQIEKNKQKITTTKRGHRCSRTASGKVRFLGHLSPPSRCMGESMGQDSH